MKVLYITNNDLSENYGGSMGCFKFTKGLDLLYQNSNIDHYLIVSFSDKHSGSLKMNEHELVIGNIISGTKRRFLVRVHGNLSQLALSYKELLNHLGKYEPDVVILQNSFLGDLANLIRRMFPCTIIIGHFDNFEYECYKATIGKANVVARQLKKAIDLPLIKRLEKLYLKNIDFATFLTTKDKNSVFSFYNISTPWTLFPIMIPDPLNSDDAPITITGKNCRKVVFTGSLDYYPNIEAAMFLDQNSNIIRKYLGANTEIILAGKNPHSKVRNLQNVRVIPNPSNSELKELMLSSDLFISSVFQGSGMKVKIIDALAYGLPIVASEHSLTGYESITEKAFIFPFRDRNSNAFENALSNAKDILETKDRTTVFKIQRELFRDFFSIYNAEKTLSGILKDLTKEGAISK